MVHRFYTFLERNAPSQLKAIIPSAWRIKLGYLIKVGWRRPTVEPGFTAHSLTLPTGESEASVFDYLASYWLEEEGPLPRNELRAYLLEAYRRFLYTLQLIPPGDGKLLEIGANPYFMSLLLRRFTQYQVMYTNYFGSSFESQSEQVLITRQRERLSIPFQNINVEKEPLPFDDDTFDVILLCEVIEHFTEDPLYALLNISRVLKPGGSLILTTPNVARLENVARLLAGENIYDPYSGYGPYGRHNREYTMEELSRLLIHAGFKIEQRFTSDVHYNHSHLYADPEKLVSLIRPRQTDLGQYLFVQAKNSGQPITQKPDWLYRSYPPEEILSAGNQDHNLSSKQ
jgi:SAM-dependent methyltransferase